MAVAVCEEGCLVGHPSRKCRKRKELRGRLFAQRAKTILNPFFLSSYIRADIVREKVPLIDHTGISLYLESFKVDDGQKKLPLLMVHGLTYSSHEFDVDYKDYSLVRFLAKSGYEVWLLDIAGYGRSQQVEDGFMTNSDYAAENLVYAARKILSLRGGDRIDLFGWSWGGLVASKFAIKYPRLLRKLVLYAPLTFGLKEKAVDSPFINNTWAHAADDFQLSSDGKLDLDITEPSVVDLYVSNCRRYDRDVCPNGGRREVLISPHKNLFDAGAIKAPTLILGGTNDQYCSVENCQYTYSNLGDENSKLVIFDGASHMMMIEKPYYRSFRQHVVDFLLFS